MGKLLHQRQIPLEEVKTHQFRYLRPGNLFENQIFDLTLVIADVKKL